MPKTCSRCRKVYDEGVLFCPEDGAPVTASNALDPAVAAALASDYRILDWLGSGGMGAVFLAEQFRVGNRKVALKVLHRKFSEDEEFITRFQNEAASTGRINHPNVITIYESKQASDGTLYIAMELVEGESLTERLRKPGRLPLDEAVEITAQCCKALQAAHRLGIIHRDIKPDNIMLTRDLDGGLLVKILDFGIAKLKDSGGHTATGSVLGTPAYMSYEQASGLSSEKLDGRSDIYSLGAVTYAMLVGHPPFRADTPVGYITKHLSEPPAPIRPQRPDVPAAVEAAVLKALEKDRDKRYQRAADFATALREAARAAAAAPVAPPVRPSATQPTQVIGPTPVPVTSPPAPTPVGPTPTVPPWRAVPTPATVPPPRPAPPPPAPPVAAPARPPAPPRPQPTVPARPAASISTSPPVAPTPTAPVHRAPTTRVQRPVEREEGSGEGLAAAVWGLRFLIAWGMRVYALMFLLLFAWQFVGAFLPASVIVPVAIFCQPVLDLVARVVPAFTVGGLDPWPLIVAVALFLVRPRITTPLAQLEERLRTRAAAG